MGVMSIRMDSIEERRIAELAKALRKDKSSVARDLLDQGWSFYWIGRYRQGKASLGILSRKLGLPYSDLIDLLASSRSRPRSTSPTTLPGRGFSEEALEGSRRRARWSFATARNVSRFRREFRTQALGRCMVHVLSVAAQRPGLPARRKAQRARWSGLITSPQICRNTE